jgi:surface polysaccharide O-acyltransferase-like enzyme
MDWWVCNIIDSACRWVVPAFVMLSGALLLHPAKKEPPAVFFRKRMTRIAIPFVFWTTFYLLWERFYNADHMSARDIIDAVLSGSPYYHLHFISIIIGLYLLTPALRTFLRNSDSTSQVLFVVTAFVLAMGDTLIRTHNGSELNLFTRFAPYVGYYCSGYLLRDKTLSSRGEKRAWMGLVGAISLTAMIAGWVVARKGVELAVIIYDPLSPTSIIMSICVFLIAGSLAARHNTSIRGNNLAMRKLAEATLGVYLIHPALLDVFRHHGVTAAQPTVWLGTFGVSTMVVIGSFVLAACVRRVPYLRSVV